MNTHRVLVIASSFVFLLAAKSHAAPVTLGETVHNLEGSWAFRIDATEVGETERWFAPEYNDSTWRQLTVPGLWEPQGVTDPRPGEAPKPKNGMPWTDYDGVAWYRFHFTIPAEWANKPLLLRLGHVDDEDRTYVNGSLVGETNATHPNPASRRYTIPAGAVFAGKENVLAVRVMDGGGPGGLIGPALSLLPAEGNAELAPLLQSDRPIAERFSRPPADSRILKIIHGPPDSPEEQNDLLNELLEDGFGGVVTNVSFDHYLESEEKWAAFKGAITLAKKDGMSLWLYDEKGYPSGLAGGITLRDHPEWEARGRYFVSVDSDGGPVTLDLAPGTLVRAAAFHRSGDGIELQSPTELTERVKDGKLTWDAPKGAWRIIVITEDRLYDGTHAAVSLGDKLPYVNLLMAEPIARFLQVTHGEYAKRLGDDLGKWFDATFTDEPSLMSMFMKAQPWRVLPWSPGLASEFEKRRGYPLDPMLPALVSDAGPKTAAARYDFWLTVAELVSQNYFGQIRDWCRAHHVPSGGHLLLEEPLLMHVPLYGDYFRCARQLDAPSIDCLTSIPEDVPWFIARQIGSIADLEGRAQTMCETSDHVQRYRPAGDTRPVRVVTENEIRGTLNRLMVNGVNTITSYYQFGDLTPAQLVRLNEWTGRCCTMLRGGHQAADIALLYPIESAWIRFTPARHMVGDSPEAARRVERAYRSAGEDLYTSGRDFTYVDSQALSDAKAEGGALTLNALKWRVVILPETDTLPLKAWEHLGQFWRGGGIVIALGARPANSEKEFPAPGVTALANELFGPDTGAIHSQSNPAGGVGVFLPRGSEALLASVLGALLERDVQVSSTTAPIRATHRVIDGRQVYFLINDGPTAWQGNASFAADGAGEQWDPTTGKQTPVVSAQNVPLSLGPYGGMLYRFERATAPQRHALTGDLADKPRTEPLPEASPTVSKGEFVQAELSAHPALEGAPAWRAKATLTKSKVDTFLFAAFDYPKPLDLSKASLISFSVDTPTPPQKAHVTLLLIVRDSKGAEYMVEAGHALSTPGMQQPYIRLNQLRRASWSKDAAGALDLSAITGIRIGWGGYLGTENETVEFSFTAPKMVAFGK